MKNKLLLVLMLTMVGGVALAGCSETTSTEKAADTTTAASVKKENSTKGDSLTTILTKTDWQGTRVYDKDNNDLTAENANFIGLAKYDGTTGQYEFFDKESGKSRGDEGTFFITADGAKRILISSSQNYQAVVDLTEVTNEKFTYKRMGKDQNGKEVEVFVEHVPYGEEKLSFTNEPEKLKTSTGEIVTSEDGNQLLGKTLWNGTKVIDEDGNDLTAENQMFISLAKFDDATNKYEFFDKDSGKSRGDFGYFKVLDHNKIRAHVSLGENKYGAALELTELNDKRFTYARMGKDQAGKEIKVFVEHEPYTGKLSPEFTF